MQFEFATASRILFGPGKVREVPAAVKSMGSRVLVVRGRTGERSVALVRELGGCVEFGVDGEPTVELARRGAEVARTGRCDVVIGFGGGSAIDAGKAIAALAANPGDVLDYLEVVGEGKALPRPVAAVYRHPDHGRHRIRSDAQRRPRLARAQSQGELAQPVDAARARRRGPRAGGATFRRPSPRPPASMP